MPLTLPRWSIVLSRCTPTMIPGFLELLASRHPQLPSLPAITDGVALFGCIIRFMLQPACCLALLAGYGAMNSYVIHHAF
jgi:hypothetical protein